MCTNRMATGPIDEQPDGGYAAPRSTSGFDDLFRSTYSRLVGQLFAITTNRSEAEEAIQEAFARLWSNWEQLKAYDNLEAWVRRVAINVAVTRWRSQAKLARLGVEDLASKCEVSALQVILVQGLRQLRTAHRKALVLHYIAGLTVEEIAVELSTSPSTIKSWLSRGRSKLKSLIDIQEMTNG